MIRVKIWLKIWEKLSFSCFHPLFLEAQVSRQYSLSWLHLETKSWSTCTSYSGNDDLLSIRLYMSNVSTAEEPCGVSEKAQQGQTYSFCRPMGELCRSERVVASWKGQSLPISGIQLLLNLVKLLPLFSCGKCAGCLPKFPLCLGF